MKYAMSAFPSPLILKELLSMPSPRPCHSPSPSQTVTEGVIYGTSQDYSNGTQDSTVVRCAPTSLRKHKYARVYAWHTISGTVKMFFQSLGI